jgi:hypothetical protein
MNSKVQKTILSKSGSKIRSQVAWRTVIVDECHRIKEPAARTTIALKSLGTEYLSILRIMLFLNMQMRNARLFILAVYDTDCFICLEK